MPRSQPYDPSFSYDLGEGFLMNPSTGQIFNTATNTAYANADELGVEIQKQSESGNTPRQGSGQSNSNSSFNNIPSPSTIEKGYDQVASLLGGSGSSTGSYSLGSSLGSSAFGSQAGGIGSSQLGTALGGTSAGLGAGSAAAGGYSLGTALGSSAFGSAAGGIGATAGLGSGTAAGSYSLGSALGSSAFGSAAGGVGAASGAGAGAASGGASAAGGGLSSTLGAVAWPLAIAAAIYQTGANYEGSRKASGGTLSKNDTDRLAHPFGMPKPLRGFEKFNSKIPLTPGWIMNNLFGSGVRAQERGARKFNRKVLQDAGLMNPDSRSRYNLADGSQFDISQYKANTGKDAYNINFDDPSYNADELGFANAITTAIFGDKARKGSDVKDGKTRGDLGSELYNAYNSNGRLSENSRAAGDKLGGRNAIYEAIGEKFKADLIDAQTRDNMFAAVDKKYGIANPTGARWEDTAGLNEKQKRHNDEQLAKGNKIPKTPASTTKPITAPSPLSTSSTGGKPATAINTGTFRPGASANPNFKNQPYKIPKKK